MLFFTTLSLAVLISTGTANNREKQFPRVTANVDKPVTVFQGNCYVGAKIVVEAGKTKKFPGACIAMTCNTHKLTVTEEYCDKQDVPPGCSLDLTEYQEEFPWCCPAFKCPVPVSN